MIKKIKNQYVVISEMTRRVFGRYRTRQEAEKRLRQVEFFKHLKGSKTLQGRFKKKSFLK